MPLYCNGCNVEEDSSGRMKFMHCGRCKVAFYCSRACQLGHWIEHKDVCKIGLPGWYPYKKDIAAAQEVEKLWGSKSSSALAQLATNMPSESTSSVNPIADDFFKRGKKAYGKGDLASAIQSYILAIKNNPFNGKYYARRAACLELVGMNNIALKDYIAANFLSKYNIHAWRGLIFSYYKLSELEKAKECFESFKEFQNDWDVRMADCTKESIDECVKECHNLLYNNDDPSNLPIATYVGNPDLEICHYMTEGFHRVNQQELIMVDVPTKMKAFNKGWYELIHLKESDEEFRAKTFVTGDFVKWQLDETSISYVALFFSVDDQKQVDIIKRELYRDEYLSSTRSYALVKLFPSQQEAFVFRAKYTRRYVSDVISNAHKWKNLYTAGEQLVQHDDTFGAFDSERKRSKKGRKETGKNKNEKDGATND